MMTLGTHGEQLTGGEVGLDEHLARRHEVRMCVQVETRGDGHKVHERGRATVGVKLVRRHRTSTLVGRIGVWHLPVDVPARGEATDEDDGTVGECFGTRVPAHARSRTVSERRTIMALTRVLPTCTNSEPPL